jgi:pseudaminic acid cytidylyltransferase
MNINTRRHAIAVIPARGGSKRIPRKNVKPFLGKPMITYAISTALESGLFDHVIVSTDDDEISEVAISFGAEVPFLRPASLSDDYTVTVTVVQHAITKCSDIGWASDYVCCIYPCVPLLQTTDLQRSLQIFLDSNAKFCYPVVEFESPIQRALLMDNNGGLSFVNPKDELTRTQDLVTTFHDAGQFYWGSTESWLSETKMHSNAVGYPIPTWRTIDIDTFDDWKRAEILAKSLDSKLS